MSVVSTVQILYRRHSFATATNNCYNSWQTLSGYWWWRQ